MANSTEVSVVVSRANAYYVLARAMGLPALMDGSQPPLLREAFAGLGDSLSTLGLNTAQAWETALQDKEQTAVAFAQLFLGPFEILASPYATTYLTPENSLMGEASQEAARAYSEAGLVPDPEYKEAPDHITGELEFMYYLAFQEGSTDDPAWSERQRRFWTEHLGRWLSELAGAIVQADCHPFYNALGELLEAFAADEAARFSGPSSAGSGTE